MIRANNGKHKYEEEFDKLTEKCVNEYLEENEVDKKPTPKELNEIVDNYYNNEDIEPSDIIYLFTREKEVFALYPELTKKIYERTEIEDSKLLLFEIIRDKVKDRINEKMTLKTTNFPVHAEKRLEFHLESLSNELKEIIIKFDITSYNEFRDKFSEMVYLFFSGFIDALGETG
jgi:hypothetical protein